MNRRLHPILALSLLAAMPAISAAQGVTIRRDEVIPVVMDDNLTIRNAHPGDRFRAHVDDDRTLPFDTRFEGRITGVKDRRGDDPAALELIFTDVFLPDGTRLSIDALPVPMSRVSQDRDGRFVAKRDDRKKGNAVLGGAIGGFILGSILHKQLEATIIGTVAGILVAETDKSNDGNTVLTKGSTVGVLFNQDLRIDTRYNGRNPFDRSNDGWRRNNGDNRDQNRDQNRNENQNEDQNRNQNEDWRNDDRPPVSNPPIIANPPDVDRNVPISLRYNNQDLRFTRNKPYREGRFVMVPLGEAAIQLGLHPTTPGEDGTFYVDGGEGYLKLRVDSREVKVNGRSAQSDASAVKRDGVTYVSARVLAQICKDNLEVDGQKIEKDSLEITDDNNGG